MKIPKIIHQTWKSKEKNESIDTLRNTWMDKNPGYQYCYYDDTDIENFIKKHFSPQLLSFYKRIIAGSLKADMFRYCVLYIHGGFYIDVDISCVKPLDEVIDSHSTMVTTTDHCSSQYSDRIYQAFLGTVPRCSLFLGMIQCIVDNMNAGRFRFELFQLSGPVLFSSLLKKYINNTLKIESSIRFLSAQKITKEQTGEHFEIFTHNIGKEQLESNDGVVFAIAQHKIDRKENLHYYDDRSKFPQGFYV